MKNKSKEKNNNQLLEIKDLHVEIEGKEIIKGINLKMELGKIVALMGPNGSGKSTLVNTLMGHPSHIVTKGKIMFNGKDITELSPDERAKLGLFLSFQYPKEIPGVSVSNFLRTAYNSLHPKQISVPDFVKLLREKMKLLKIDESFSRRHLNEGFSGGEKKRAEILQLLVLEPKYALLDETDSGLDVDAIKTVAQGIATAKKEGMGVLLITHYSRFLEYLQPDHVSILYKGKIIAQGDKKLAQRIEKEGFEKVIAHADKGKSN